MSTKPITDTITAPILDIVEARDCIATLNQILEDVTNLIWLIQQDTRPVQITEKSLLRAIGGYIPIIMMIMHTLLANNSMSY